MRRRLAECGGAPRDLQLLLADGPRRVRRRRRARGRGARSSTSKAHTIERTFWDTFDARVRGAGLALVDADGRLALPDATTHAEQAAGPGRGAAGCSPPTSPAGALRDRLEAILEMRARVPVARVAAAGALRLLDDERKTVVRLRARSRALAGDGRPRRAARRACTSIGVRGYDSARARVPRCRARARARCRPPAPARRGRRRRRRHAGGRLVQAAPEADPDDRSDAAAAAILRRLLEIIDANLPGTLADVDTEFLHDLRVAVRRTRALQRELAASSRPTAARASATSFQRLQQITGPTRDLDVHLLEFDELAAGLPASAARPRAAAPLLEERRARERRRDGRARCARARHARAARRLASFLDGLRSAERRPAPTPRARRATCRRADRARSTARW